MKARDFPRGDAFAVGGAVRDQAVRRMRRGTPAYRIVNPTEQRIHKLGAGSFGIHSAPMQFRQW